MKNQSSNEEYRPSFLDRNAFAVMMCILGAILVGAGGFWAYGKYFKVKEVAEPIIEYTQGDPKKQTMVTFDLTEKNFKYGSNYYQDFKTFNKKIDKVRVDSAMIVFVSYPDTSSTNVITVNEFAVVFKGIPHKLRNTSKNGNRMTLDYTKEGAEVTYIAKNKKAVTFGVIVNSDGTKDGYTTKVEVSKDKKTRTFKTVAPKAKK